MTTEELVSVYGFDASELLDDLEASNYLEASNDLEASESTSSTSVAPQQSQHVSPSNFPSAARWAWPRYLEASEATSSTSVAPQQSQQCIGAGIKLPHCAPCTPDFIARQPHLQDKFCDACRAGFAVSKAQVRVLPSAHEGTFTNSTRGGFWNEEGEIPYRVINHNAKCKGPSLILFRGAAPIRSDEEPIPNHWVHDGDTVWLHVAYGTLVPHLKSFTAQAKRIGRPPKKRPLEATLLPHAAPQPQSIQVNVAPELSATISALASAAMRSLVAPANPHHPHHTNSERWGFTEEVSVSASIGSATSTSASASTGSSSPQALPTLPNGSPQPSPQRASSSPVHARTEPLQQATTLVRPPSPPMSPPGPLLALVPAKVRIHPITLRFDDEDTERELGYRSFDTSYYVLSLFLILDMVCRGLFPLIGAGFFPASETSTVIAHMCIVVTHVSILAAVRRFHSMPKHEAAAFKSCVWTTLWAINTGVYGAMLHLRLARRLTAAEGQAAAVACAMWAFALFLQHVLHIEFRCRMLVMLMAVSLALTSVEWRNEMLAALMFGEAVGYSIEYMARSLHLTYAKSAGEMGNAKERTGYDLQMRRAQPAALGHGRLALRARLRRPKPPHAALPRVR